MASKYSLYLYLNSRGPRHILSVVSMHFNAKPELSSPGFVRWRYSHRKDRQITVNGKERKNQENPEWHVINILRLTCPPCFAKYNALLFDE